MHHSSFRSFFFSHSNNGWWGSSLIRPSSVWISRGITSHPKHNTDPKTAGALPPKVSATHTDFSSLHTTSRVQLFISRFFFSFSLRKPKHHLRFLRVVSRVLFELFVFWGLHVKISTRKSTGINPRGSLYYVLPTCNYSSLKALCTQSWVVLFFWEIFTELKWQMVFSRSRKEFSLTSTAVELADTLI